ncbi:hypothetical protein HAPG_00041 [Halorubrum phage GNf2]|nr:hypothetical protein HAPG_00041 [Halorubrum phage GNf2]
MVPISKATVVADVKTLYRTQRQFAAGNNVRWLRAYGGASSAPVGSTPTVLSQRQQRTDSTVALEAHLSTTVDRNRHVLLPRAVPRQMVLTSQAVLKTVPVTGFQV